MLRNLLKYVEIQTKITGIFTFLMSLAYLFYVGQPINRKLTLIFFAAVFLFDMTTTAINNYIDSRDYPKMLPLKRRPALLLILVMFFTSTALGLYLAYCTDFVVLILGVLCFLCGVCYTYGPVPISRMPLGELFSGVFEGMLVPFLLFYINMPDGTYLTLSLSFQKIRMTLQILPLLTVLLLSIVPACATANIMLANNTCDVEKDVLVKRHTLPYYIGKENAVRLFAALYYAAYLAPCVMAALDLLSPVCLLSLLTFPAVQKNIRIFQREQKKETTFIVAIRNYILLMTGYSLSLLLSGIFARL